MFFYFLHADWASEQIIRAVHKTKINYFYLREKMQNHFLKNNLTYQKTSKYKSPKINGSNTFFAAFKMFGIGKNGVHLGNEFEHLGRFLSESLTIQVFRVDKRLEI